MEPGSVLAPKLFFLYLVIIVQMDWQSFLFDLLIFLFGCSGIYAYIPKAFFDTVG